MILWCDGLHDPAENMIRDRALLARAGAVADGDLPAADGVVLRLFGFSPAGITLGRAQDPAKELDLVRCERDGVPWAVRPTGGRAIFHAEEWTYSLATPQDDATWGGPLPRAYATLARLLVGSLERLGVPAAFAAGARRVSPGPRAFTAGSAAPCFASTARYEIVRDGRKLIGSAQRRSARGLLQQGSLLLGDGHLRLIDYLRIPGREQGHMRDALRASSGHAGDVLGPQAPLEGWAEALLPLLPPGTIRLDGAAGGHLLTP